MQREIIVQHYPLMEAYIHGEEGSVVRWTRTFHASLMLIFLSARSLLDGIMPYYCQDKAICLCLVVIAMECLVIPSRLPQQLIYVSGKSKDMITRIIAGPTNVKVVQIAAGAEHSAFITDSGSIMTWGWGEHGQLGLGNTIDQTAPQVVGLHPKSACANATPRLYCGSGFSFVLITRI